MPTNLAIDQNLLEQALKSGGRKTKRETVNEALAEYVQRRKQQEIVDLFGKINYEKTYNYKKHRKRT